MGLEYAPHNRTCVNKAFAKKIGAGSAFKSTVKLHTKGLPGPAYVRVTPCTARLSVRHMYLSRRPLIDGGSVGPGPGPGAGAGAGVGAGEEAVELDEEGKPIPKSPPQEQGFFQKYVCPCTCTAMVLCMCPNSHGLQSQWMYIIPGLLLFNAMGAANPPQQQAAGEEQSGTAAAQPQQKKH